MKIQDELMKKQLDALYNKYTILPENSVILRWMIKKQIKFFEKKLKKEKGENYG